MSVIFSARRISELALRNIGAFSINDEAAPKEYMDEALARLDLIMAEVAGSRTRQWLVQSNVDVSLTGGLSEFTLDGAFNQNGLQFPKLAMLNTGNNNLTEVTIVDREEFDSLPTPDSGGDPFMCHIDRLPTPTLRIYPTPAATVTPTRVLTITFAEFAPDFEDSVSGNVATELRPAWQNTLINRLSQVLGSGPVRRLAIQERREYERLADKSQAVLEAFEDREHQTSDPIVEAWGM